MAEYAQQREHEAGSLLGEVQALHVALSSAAQQPTADSSAGVGLAAASAQIEVCSETSHAERSRCINAKHWAGICNMINLQSAELRTICLPPKCCIALVI